MRVAADTNIYISYLLKPNVDSSIHLFFQLRYEGAFELVTLPSVLNELDRNLRTKPYLLDRLPLATVDRFLSSLSVFDIRQNVKPTEFMEIMRDVDDALILAEAIYADADVLVTGDKDLLVMTPFVGRPKIMTAAQFIEWMGTRSSLDQD